MNMAVCEGSLYPSISIKHTQLCYTSRLKQACMLLKKYVTDTNLSMNYSSISIVVGRTESKFLNENSIIWIDILPADKPVVLVFSIAEKACPPRLALIGQYSKCNQSAILRTLGDRKFIQASDLHSINDMHAEPDGTFDADSGEQPQGADAATNIPMPCIMDASIHPDTNIEIARLEDAIERRANAITLCLHHLLSSGSADGESIHMDPHDDLISLYISCSSLALVENCLSWMPIAEGVFMLLRVSGRDGVEGGAPSQLASVHATRVSEVMVSLNAHFRENRIKNQRVKYVVGYVMERFASISTLVYQVLEAASDNSTSVSDAMVKITEYALAQRCIPVQATAIPLT